MSEQKFGLIINPYAKQIKKRYLANSRLFWEALLKPEEYILPDGIDRVKDGLARQIDRGVSTLGVFGGDGTVNLVLTELLKMKASPLPAILPFRGGTINALCNNLGNRDAPEDTLKKFLGITPSHRLQTYKHLIRVEESDDHDPSLRYGFSFANGALVRAYNEYYKSKNPGFGAALRIIFKIFGTGMVSFGYGKGVLAPVDMKVVVPGAIEREGKFRVVVASVLENPTLWWKPFGQELNGQPAFHYLVNSMATYELAWNMWDLFNGRTNHPSHSVGKTGVVCVESDGGYILDGEVFGVDKKLSIKITLGPALKFITIS
jgi:diacylglycerol kinase family enzyme